MSNNKELLLLALVAIVAIIGLILMIKLSSSGMFSVSSRSYPYPEYGDPRAPTVYSTLPYKAASPGKIVGLGTRTRRLECTGFQACPEDHPYRISMSAYISSYGYYGDRCVEPTCEPPEGSIMCCKSGFSPR